MNLPDLFRSVDQYFSPKVIGEVNDVYIKIARIKGNKIPWHKHNAEDELFYIVEGTLLMELEGEKPFTMKTGDLFIVPRGTIHRISSKAECRIMLVENKSTAHTGEVRTEITRSIQQQLK